ncbi:MAG: hypothetical protein JWL98_952, partial [Xanthomonadaceae bacterium]|nr:hypothetical protein [Xanthomonadaceae bacterium]
MRRFQQRRQLALLDPTRRFVTRDRALVAQAAGYAVERLQRYSSHGDLVPARGLFDFGQARIAAAGLEQHLAHVVAIVLDGRRDGVDTG